MHRLPSMEIEFMGWVTIIALALLLIYHVLRILFAFKNQMVGREEMGSEALSPHRLQDIPKLTFLVPGWNAASDIQRFVSSYRNLDGIDKQLVLCIGGPDGSFELAQQYADDDIVVLEQLPGLGKQKALRKSLPFATGEWIFLTDIDSEISTSSLLRMTQALHLGGADCVTGGMAPMSAQRANRFVEAQWGIERYGSLKTPDYVSGILGANTLLTKEALQATGGFSQDAPSGTDYTLAKELIRTGHKIRYVHNAEVNTEFSDTLGLYVRRRARWLRNVVVLGKKYRCHDEVRSVLTTVAIAYAYPLLLLVGLACRLSWILLIFMAVHAMLNRIRYNLVSTGSWNIFGIALTQIGDVFAGIQTGFEVLRGSVRW